MPFVQGDDGAQGSKGRRTRERILQTAEEVFGRRGYHDATISEITGLAGVAQGSFYLHFPSKREIFGHLLRTRSAELSQVLEDAAQEAGGPIADRQRASFKAFFTWIQEHPWIFRVARLAEFVDPQLREEWYRSFAEGYARTLERAMADGSIADAEPEVLAWAIMGMADFTAMRWIVWEDGQQMPDDIPDAFVDIMLRTLGAPRSAASGSRID